MRAQVTTDAKLWDPDMLVSPDSSIEKNLVSSSSATAYTPSETASNQGGFFFDAEDPDPKQRGREEDEDDFFSSSTFREHSPVPPDEIRCSLLPNRLAAWSITGSNIKLSTLAAAVLINEGKLKEKDLEVFSDQEEIRDTGPSDPISGLFAAAHSTVGGVVMGIADYPVEINRMMHSSRSPQDLAAELSLDSGKGISRIIGTGLRAPMDFTLNVSRGFGNMPKLYGDDTVREQEKVTGVESGLGAGFKGLGLGLYDGVSGLFTQPVKGAQEGGVGGFFAGLGKGIGGVICKPAAGAVGLPAYAFKGIYEEIQSARGFGTNDVFRKNLVAQGQREWEMCSSNERAIILGKWYEP